MEKELGFAHFLTQVDAVGIGVLVLLLILSVVSWYFILTKSIANFLENRQAEIFMKHF